MFRACLSQPLKLLNGSLSYPTFFNLLPNLTSSRQPTPPPVPYPHHNPKSVPKPPSTPPCNTARKEPQHRALGSDVRRAHRAAAAEEAAATRSCWLGGECDCVIVAMARWHLRQYAWRQVCARRFLYMPQSAVDQKHYGSSIPVFSIRSLSR